VSHNQEKTKVSQPSGLFDFASTFTTTGLIQIIGVITGILTARLLGPIGKGDLATVFWLPGLMTAAGTLALPKAVALQVSRDQANDSTVLAAGFWLSLVWGLILAFVLYPFIPYILGNKKKHLVDISRWFLFSLPIVFCGLTLLGVDQGRQKFARFNALRLLPAVFFIIGLFILWLARKDNVNTIVLSNLLAQLLATCIRSAVAGRALILIDSFFNLLETAKLLLKKGLIFHHPALVGIILLKADMALLIHMVSAQEIGYYSVAISVSIGQISIATSLVQVNLPKIAKLEFKYALHLLLKHFRLAQPVVLSVALILTLFSHWIIRYLFGSSFLPATLPTYILIMAIAIWGLNQILDNGLRAMGHGLPGTMANGLGLISLIVFGMIFTTLYRITGMSISVLISQMVVLIILLMNLRKMTGKCFWANIYGLNIRSIKELRSTLMR
jgi:O-antigen/teichoic acid export membrane protein